MPAEPRAAVDLYWLPRHLRSPPMARRCDRRHQRGGRQSAEEGAHLVMRIELRPKGTLRLLLPILGRFMHKQEERNLAAIKQALEGSGSGVARRGA